MTSRTIVFRQSDHRDVDGSQAFLSMCNAFDLARRAAPEELQTFRFALAGGPIRIETAGQHLDSLMKHSFLHLAGIPPVDPLHLTINLWDEEVTGIPCPRIAKEGRIAEQEVDSGAGVTIGSPGDRYVGHLRPGLCLWMDRRMRHIVGWCPSVSQLSEQDRGKPFQFALMLRQADRGMPVIHAACVAHQERGALLVGKGGKGKTTTSLACLNAGFDFLADDYVALQRSVDDQLIGHSLYDSLWVTPHGRELFSVQAPARGIPNRATAQKTLVHVLEIHPQQIKNSTEIHAVFSVNLTESLCTCHPIPSAEALLAVAPSSMLQLPVSGKLLFDRMAELVAATPCYQLDVGPDPSALPQLICAVLEKEEDRP